MKRKAKAKAPPPRPAPAPSPWWIFCLLLGGFAVLGLSHPVELGPQPWLAQQGIVLQPQDLLLVAVGVVGAGIVGAVHYMHRYAFARSHADEPWLWDHSWRRVLGDEQLSTLLARLPRMLALGFMGVFLHGVFLAGLLAYESRQPAMLAFGLFALLFDVVVIPREFLPFMRDALALLRYGRTRLHLPAIPLALGKTVQVELTVPRGLAELTQVRAVLRNVRERVVRKRVNQKRRTVTVRDIDYERVQKVDLGRREDGILLLELNVPDNREAGSVLSSHPRVLWELQLTSEVTGLDLDVTFVLPVYRVTGKRRTAEASPEEPGKSVAG